MRLEEGRTLEEGRMLIRGWEARGGKGPEERRLDEGR